MAHTGPVSTDLDPALLAAVRQVIGADAGIWRAKVAARKDLPASVSVEEGGPRLVGGRLTFDVRLLAASGAALRDLGPAPGLEALEDRLVYAAANAVRRDSPFTPR